MEPNIAELEAATAAAKKAAEEAGGTDENLNKALSDAEQALAKAKAPSHRITRSEKEKAEYTLKKVASRVKELGGNPEDVLGVGPFMPDYFSDDLDDDRPLTVKDLRNLQKQDAKKTAVMMAEDIEDEAEREAVKALLESRIAPSGNPESDLALARGAANALKNARIAEEMARRSKPPKTASGGSGQLPLKDEFVPTEQERIFMSPPYNMTVEQLKKLRKE